jgi:hypothetical protein
MALTPIDGIVETVVGIAGKVLDRIIPDPAQRAAAALEMAKLQQSGELAKMQAETQLAQGQIDTNKIEAAAGMFRGGWRPFIGWVCGAALGYEFVVRAFLVWLTPVFHFPTAPPELPMGDLLTILGGILGLGSLRTVEKTQGLK